MNTQSDKVFDRDLGTIEDFSFDKRVATVFDDMVSRSVPFYDEMQRMIVELARDYAQPKSSIYDLGCASGTTLLGLQHAVDLDVNLIGVDNSEDMLNTCREKIDCENSSRQITLTHADICERPSVKNASVVILVLTLQFVRPCHRARLIEEIFGGILPGGCLIVVEKVLGENPQSNRRFISYYHELKRRHGYSELEVSQKREALENVLIPYRLSENCDLLSNAGFADVDVFFKWYNFAGIVAFRD